MRSRCATILGSALLLACGRDVDMAPSDIPGVPASIAVGISSPDELTSTGETRVANAVVRDAVHATISAPVIAWTSSDPRVATVNGTGTAATITAVDDGAAVISATAGNVHAMVSITVRRRLAALEIMLPNAVMQVGTTAQLLLVGRDARGEELHLLTGVAYTSSDPARLSITPAGVVTALFNTQVSASAVIAATASGGGVVRTATRSITVSTPPLNASDYLAFMVTEAIRPEPIFGLGQGGAYFTRNNARINYKIVWARLSGAPTSAHLHGPDGFDLTADVLVDLPIVQQVRNSDTLSGSFSAADIKRQNGQPAIAFDSLLALMQTNFVYIDLHTPAHPDGEIRGLVAKRP